MARIFISYRREDSDIWVSRLVDELRKHFPPEQVFQDIASIDPGADFVEALEKGLSTAAVMLAVIGQRWLSATDKPGRRRLDMSGDFVRREIAESLRRPGVGVFPLLVNGAEMPDEEELPEPLKALHRRQAFELTVRHWHQDVAQLIQTLKRAPGFSDDRRADEDFTPPGAEQAAQRREAEERAAKEEAERITADRAKKKAEEEARRKAAIVKGLETPTSNKRSLLLFWAPLAFLIIAGLLAFVAMFAMYTPETTTPETTTPYECLQRCPRETIDRRDRCERDCFDLKPPEKP